VGPLVAQSLAAKHAKASRPDEDDDTRSGDDLHYELMLCSEQNGEQTRAFTAAHSEATAVPIVCSAL
jgi:hypothetical protein